MRLKKVLVCGGREYDNFLRLYSVLCRIQEETGFSILVHGACGWQRRRREGEKRPANWHPELDGADGLAAKWAGGRVAEVRAYPADWDRFKRGAGPRRNKEMDVAEQPEAVIAFKGGDGTAGMCKIARAAGRIIFKDSER